MNAPVVNLPTTIEPKRSLLVEMATRYGMEAQAFANTLRATVVPKEASNEEFAAFLVVAREYNLNPLTKEIYAFPKRGGGIQPIVSVDGWCNLMVSHPQHNGLEFDDHLDKDGKLISVTARIWRKDREKPTTVTEYMAECVRSTDTWKQYPRRMLRHKALIQCARYAFGFAGIVDPDEAERVGADVSRMKTVNASDGPPAPPPAQAEASTQPAADVVWEENGERPATEEDGIPAQFRRNPDNTLPGIDSEQWRKDMDGALSACAVTSDLMPIKEKIMAMKGKVSAEAYQAVSVIYRQTFDRLAMEDSTV